ncbi:hypothetical protein [Marinospirillum sp.]|uniref:hypothetical protein n=1 Tax=Marinospirillum sp. TaxID=2183934 RepID=UPI002870704E|nr:hypothetical protein [Marinospirillum sp.]
MYYVIASLVAVFLIYQIIKFKSIEKHDRHLFRFCQLRRDTLAFIADNQHQLTREEYHAARQLLDGLNTIIEHYHNKKMIIFDLRRFARHVQKLKSMEGKADQITVDNKQINDLKLRFQYNMVRSFLAYTPFLKSEVAMWLVKVLLQFMAKTGKKKIDKYLTSLKDVKLLVDRFNDTNKYA